MFCSECGNQIKDGAMFCGKCGTKVEKIEETPVEVTPEPEVEVVPEVEVEAEPEVEVVPEVEVAPEQAPKKKKAKAPKIVIAILVAIAILAGGFFVFKDAIINKAMFLLPAEMQFQYVCKNAAEDLVEKTNEIVAEVNKAEVPTEQETTGTLSVTVGDSIKSMLESQADIDLGDIDTVYADYEVAYNENQYLIGLGVGLEETDLLSMDIVMDMEKESMAISIPELSKTAVEFDMQKDMEISKDDLEVLKTASEKSKESVTVVKDILPEEKLTEELVPRYVATLIKAIDEVERAKGTVEVGDVSQKATSLTVVLDDEMMNTISEAVVEELEKDEALQTYIKDAMKNIAEYVDEEYDDDDFEEVYDALIDGVKEMFDAMGESEVVEDGIELVIWINSNNEIIGVVMDEYVEIASAKDGQQVASQMIISDEDTEYLKLIAEGEEDKKDGSFSGDVKLYVEEDVIIKVQVNKYSYTDEKFELDSSIKFGDAIGSMTGMSSITDSLAIGLDITSTADTAKIGLSGKFQGNELLDIGFAAKNSSEVKITYPKDAKGATEMDAWLETIDFSTVLDNLDEAGVLDILGVEKALLKSYLEQSMESSY